MWTPRGDSTPGHLASNRRHRVWPVISKPSGNAATSGPASTSRGPGSDRGGSRQTLRSRARPMTGRSSGSVAPWGVGTRGRAGLRSRHGTLGTWAAPSRHMRRARPARSAVACHRSRWSRVARTTGLRRRQRWRLQAPARADVWRHRWCQSFSHPILGRCR